ncbi:MAG: dihydrofolate reductase family protein [Rikenellaceae bacterium]
MNITISVAISADNFMDDNSPQRLILSNQEDWAEVYRLRADSDAILIGAQTLRSDNPSLGVKSEELREARTRRGSSREPVRVVLSGKGVISADLKLFNKGEGQIIIFSNIARPELEHLCEVVVKDSYDIFYVITELEKRGIKNLFVEGGVNVLNQLFATRLYDRVRVARNTTVMVKDSTAPHLKLPTDITSLPVEKQTLAEVEVSTYFAHKQDNSTVDKLYMSRAVEASRNSPPAATCYRVGAVVVTSKGEIFEGYTHEGSPTHHAEQIAIFKAQKNGAELKGSTIYSTIEPCSKRTSEPKSCSQLIMELGFSRVVFALYEPSCFVCCEGASNLRRAGVEVKQMAEFEAPVRKINAHVIGE